jgi:hypothetical protein
MLKNACEQNFPKKESRQFQSSITHSMVPELSTLALNKTMTESPANFRISPPYRVVVVIMGAQISFSKSFIFSAPVFVPQTQNHRCLDQLAQQSHNLNESTTKNTNKKLSMSTPLTQMRRMIEIEMRSVKACLHKMCTRNKFVPSKSPCWFDNTSSCFEKPDTSERAIIHIKVSTLVQDNAQRRSLGRL